MSSLIMSSDAQLGKPPELNDDVLLAIAQVLEGTPSSRPDLLSCCLVCRQWCRLARHSIRQATWQLLSDPGMSTSNLLATLHAYPRLTDITISFPSDPSLLRPHFHAALTAVLHACPSIQSVTVRAPRTSKFSFAPALTLTAPLLEPPLSLNLHSLCIMGHLADAAYRELHLALPHLAPCLTRLSIKGKHPWSNAWSARQLLELPSLLPCLEALELPMAIGETQAAQSDETVSDWCHALQGLSRLTSLQRLAMQSALFHLPSLAEAVRSWHVLPRLRELELQVEPLLQSCAELEDLLWLDPELLTAQVWVGVLPQLRGLTSLVLTSDELCQALWADLASCSWLHRLELHHTSWGLDFDIAAQPFTLHSLQSLRLCLGDADLSVICLPSLSTSLHTLHLELKGMDYGEAAQAGEGESGPAGDDAAMALRQAAASAADASALGLGRPPGGLGSLWPLASMRHFSCDAVSLCLSEQMLNILSAAWPRLESFRFKGLSKVTSIQGLSSLQHLRDLELLSRDPHTGPRAPQRRLCVLHLPASLTCLRLDDALLTPSPDALLEARQGREEDEAGLGGGLSAAGQRHGAELRLRRLGLHRCLLAAPLHELLPACLSQLELLDVRSVDSTQSGPGCRLEALAAAFPSLNVLRIRGSHANAMRLCAHKDCDLELMASTMHRLEELELGVSSLVTSRGLSRLRCLGSLRSLQLNGPIQALHHCSCFTDLTQLRSLVLNAKQEPNGSGLSVAAMLDKLVKSLRAFLPDCSVEQALD